ncbi:M56 family metallopeptidase [Ascidiimonas sp. W6]|uniref:M56 family metallopeptidase n=1 Tax=Ascidiimonas meishanensis TaxID=3128903 RepID=UPI0030EBCCA7
MIPDFLIYLLKSSGVLFLFLLTYILLLERETFFKGNRLFLILGIFISFAWPFFEIVSSIEVTAVPMETLSSSNLPSTDTVIATENNSWSPYSLLIWFYGLGVLILGIRMLFHLYLLYHTYKNKESFNDNGIRYVYSNAITEPSSFFNIIFINRNHYDKNDFELIKLHEQAHVIQQHSYDMILLQLLCIVLWFHPFSWIYKLKATQNLEYLADQFVVERNANLKNYQYLLLKNTVKNAQPLLANTFFNSFIKKRIVMLIKNKSSKSRALKYVSILPLLFFFTIVFNTRTEAQQVVSDSTTSTLKQNDINLATITKSSTDKQLQDLVDLYKKSKIDLTFTEVKRNTSGEIIAIKVNSIDSKGLESGFQIRGQNSFPPIMINDLLMINRNLNFATIEDVPVFPGCEGQPTSQLRECFEEKLNEHITANLRVPEVSTETPKGRVFTLFTIKKDGTIGNIKMRGPNKAYEAEALRILKTLPKMTPAKLDGKAVNIDHAIPINFLSEP